MLHLDHPEARILNVIETLNPHLFNSLSTCRCSALRPPHPKPLNPILVQDMLLKRKKAEAEEKKRLEEEEAGRCA